MSFVVTAVVAAIAEGATVAVMLTAVAEVGMALTVVGAVTKSKELTKIGSAMALVGGVGGIINGMATGALGAGVAAAGEGAADAALGASAAQGAEAGWASMAGDAVSGINSAGIAPIAFDGASAATVGAGTTMPGLGASNSLTSFLGTKTPDSSIPGLGSDSSGMMTSPASGQFTNEYGLPAGGATDKVLGVDGPAGIADIATPAGGGMMDTLKSKVGGAWESLGALGKAELLKSVLAMPGGIQNQKNVEAGLAIQQQKANQTSYGSAVPTFGIINKAKG